jgi:hypothetical protein
MANMSYCRFRNTLDDLREANEHIPTNFKKLEEDERAALIRLIKLCHRIADDYPLEDLPNDNT